ncbi:hypothetical protein JCGZ_06031 [Jatropha curcas]|uniref:Aminotransferase-like plant mobile domain-containing protein n=1 Tax=Jatropha curcas TaxID=180498 RepID=A0A067JLN9_JATCU|nr:hypothetical protein JCGZ_06031 [Jatropha curcas]
MSQLSEIPSSAYTPEMNTLGAIPDIPTFEGEPAPVSQNPLTSGMQPLQLLLLPGTEFPVRYETSRMHGFQTEVDLGKASAGGSSTDASAFWDLLDPPMRAQVIAAGFGDCAAGLRRTQPRFPLATRYTLMERWNDCTHTFVFGFGGDDTETGRLRCYYGAQICWSSRSPGCSVPDRYTWSSAGPLSTRCDHPDQNRGDPAVLVCLRDLSRVGSFDWATLALAHLYHGLDVWTRGSGESNWQFIRPLEYGPTSTASIQAVRAATPWLIPGGFLGIWPTAIIPSPVPRIPITGAASDSLGGRGLEDLSGSSGSGALYPV